MSRENFRIVISDMPDKEEPVAEIWYKNEYWVEISYEDHGYFVTHFYNKRNNKYWEFSYEEAIKILQEAKEHLSTFQRTPEAQAEYEARQKELENWKPTAKEQREYEAKMEAQRKKYYG